MWSTIIMRFPAQAKFLSRGALVSAGMAALASLSVASSSTQCEELKEPKVALSPKEYRSFTVRKVETVNHNTKRITFALPSPDHEMGLTTPSCLMARARVDGKMVARPYTPTNVNTEKGFLELVVKGYPMGKMSKHIVNLEYKSIGMIAGGSGITPMLQLIKTICRNPEDHTEITLIYCSVSEKDIILREEVEAMMYLYPQVSVIHVLSNPSAEWEGLSGFVSKEMIEKYMPEPSDNNLVCVCGPPPMMYHVSGDKDEDKTQGELQGLLKELKYTSSQVFKF
ncbi:nadh-cytochrome b5 [Plasmopara halstedii]|uniref:Nadh-cytochrome b5 n=1 Tax=Plasmopara halstedii TaxID=4781 RepID=A0A0P1AVN4_PLAHL|nr:nadh-cytochrome b5 [Plasmopara halstedii]CEG44749.1 nadh-cytochrome b5 [Plasmopara halstedii]|eukprot:XP_024581118.1 nadh-cytochrome b5 [Plasmopara halstedii]